jgi:4'-phosphopantetheinyl transferase
MKLYSVNPTFLLDPGEVHVWLFELDNPGRYFPNGELFLSEEETRRANHYRFVKDRQRFVARRSLLRQLLGQYCGIGPHEITYQTNQFGKPSLSSQPFRFNLSACRNRVLIAITLEKEVGVDLEQVRRLPELARMAEQWFSPSERNGIHALAPEMKLDAFYHVWTQKEAFAKAHGEGLSMPLQDFSVSVDPDLPGGLRSIRGVAEVVSAWKMYTEVPAAGWKVAVCVQVESEPDIHWCMPATAESIFTGG